MKAKLIFIFLLFSVTAFSQGEIDTLRCGDFIGYGKILDGKKEGVWHYDEKIHGHYQNVGQGSYQNGEKTGEWIIYPYASESEKRIVHYKNNLLDGAIEIYWFNKLVGKGNYSNGLKEGEWIYYHFNYGRKGISSMQYYHEGIPTGTWKYFPYSDMKYSCYYGAMNAFGKNGYWIRRDTFSSLSSTRPDSMYITKILVDSTHYVNGKRDGFFNDDFGKGNYVNGKKEGKWINYNSFADREIVEYKNGLREGNDTVWKFGIFHLNSVAFYSKDKMNGPESFLEWDNGNVRISAKGNCAPNPQHDFEHEKTFPIPVPAEMIIDLIENGIGDSRLFALSHEYEIYKSNFHPNASDAILYPSHDSLINLLKNSKYIAYNDSPFSMREEVRVGHWNYYWENGNKKMEGTHLPIVFDSISWDSTNQQEDPYNPGTFILVPLKAENPIYYKTGWWKYYNEEDILIREERYDENGKLVETNDTLGLGYHCYYWPSGIKKEEGILLPIKYNDVLWDSTNQEEDPNNPGTFIIVPKKIERPAYYKSGWWKCYNEQGKLIREERYDEKGEEILLGERDYDEHGKLIREVTYGIFGDILEEKKY